MHAALRGRDLPSTHSSTTTDSGDGHTRAITNGFSILIVPEGHRTEHGEIQPFQSGVGILVSKLRLPVVPIRLEGVERVLHHTWRCRGSVRVTFGAALVLEGDDYAALSRRVQEAVVALQPLALEKSLRAPDAAA
jgi:1-acyl-sn-glycerol-3-phosphate acyltransferase